MTWGMKHIVFQLFGSSIMEGRIGAESASERWYEVLRTALNDHYPAVCFSIFNDAVGGASIRELMARYTPSPRGCTPDICIAMFGWNNLIPDCPDRFVSIAEQNEHIQRFFDMQAPSTQVVGVVTQPMLDQFHCTFRNPAYDDIRAQYGGVNAYHDQERENARAWFRKQNVPFLDLSLVMARDTEKYVLTSDGIHLTPAGHRLFADEMARLLIPILDRLPALQ